MLRLALLLIAMLAGSVAQAQPTPCDPTGRGGLCKVRLGEYRIRLPEGAGPYPAVLYLYGSGGRSDELARFERFTQAFTQRGYAVIIPAALTVRYSDGSRDSGWSLQYTNARGRDERKFLGQVLASAGSRFRVDRRRILMAGMSNGGFLTWEIACRDPGFAAAYAPVAANRLGPLPKACAKPVRLIHTHGRGDQIVVPTSRRWRGEGDDRWPLLGELMKMMARSNGCLGERKHREAGFDRTDWQNCSPGGDLTLLMHNGGHNIPFAWYRTVIDWFERATIGPVQAIIGSPDARPSFKSPGSRPGFKRAGSRSDQFKPARQ